MKNQKILLDYITNEPVFSKFPLELTVNENCSFVENLFNPKTGDINVYIEIFYNKIDSTKCK